MELIKKRPALPKVLALAIILLIGSTPHAFGQTFREFFNQKKKQKEYLLKQIAALQVYADYLKKGYKIANEGLQTIKDFSNGEFHLHDTFINGLKQVNPVIRNNVKVAEIIEIQLQIGKAFSQIKSNPNLSLSNQLYIQEVKENLWDESLKDLEELLIVITSNKVEMNDEERISRLDNIYQSMVDKSAFTQHFINEISLLIRQREKEKRSIEKIREYYGIKE